MEVAIEIKEILKKHYPNLGDYYLDFIDDMVNHLAELNKYHSGPEQKALDYNYIEFRECTALNKAIKRIKYHLIDENEQYIWRGDKPKNEYERGIYNAMRLLNAIVHWANPS